MTFGTLFEVSPALWAVVSLGILIPGVLLPLAARQSYRVGAARHPEGAWASTWLVASFLVAAGALLGTVAELGRLAAKAEPAVTAALVIGVLVGLLAYTLSTWQSHRGIVYFHPNQRVTYAIVALASLRIGYGCWLIWSVPTVAVERQWLAAVGMAGTLAAAALLAGYGLGFWGAVRVRIVRLKADSMFAVEGVPRDRSVRDADSVAMPR